jgi:cell division protein FtsQ
MVSIVLAIAAAIAGYVGASWPGFRPHEIRVVGNVVVPSSEILARAGIERRSNIWLQNTGAAAQRVSQIPYVLTASVHRRLPALVTIVVSERTPFANVRNGSGEAVVDQSLRVLQTGVLTGLPILSLPDETSLIPGETLQRPAARTLRDVLAAMRDRGLDAIELQDRQGDVAATLAGGVVVLFGDEDAAKDAVPLVQPILARFAALGRSVRTLDLRSPQTPVATEGALPKERARSVRLKPTDP